LHAAVLAPEAPPFQVWLLMESGRLDMLTYGELIRKEKFLCSYGFIKYQDAYEGALIRETRFCYVFQIQIGFVLISPETGKPILPDTFHIGGPSEYNNAT
jgi:hypothetical protein